MFPPVFSLHWVSLLHHDWLHLHIATQGLRVTLHMGQRTASLRVFSGFFERSHPTWHTHRATHRNQSDRILLGVRTACLSIHQDEFQYFNLSPVLQLSAQSGIIQRRWASGRDREHTIKDCYSKIDFEVIQIVCMCIGRFHYSSTILNQMSTQMLYIVFSFTEQKLACISTCKNLACTHSVVDSFNARQSVCFFFYCTCETC